MLGTHITLENSRDGGHFRQLCSRCQGERMKTDGVELGVGKWVCGKCWRMKATRPSGAVAAFKAERRGSS